MTLWVITRNWKPVAIFFTEAEARTWLARFADARLYSVDQTPLF